jgi:hypothetical protein
MSAPERFEGQRHVQVWFGSHVIASYKAEPELAARYAKAMARRFAGLRVTSEPVVSPAGLPVLPRERLWDIAPQ